MFGCRHFALCVRFLQYMRQEHCTVLSAGEGTLTLWDRQDEEKGKEDDFMNGAVGVDAREAQVSGRFFGPCVG